MAGMRGSKRLAFGVGALFMLTACGSSAHSSGNAKTTTTLAAPKVYALHGTYVQPAVQPEDVKTLPGGKASYVVHSGTVWHGDLEGHTALLMHGVVNTKTNASTGTDNETFTGTMKGLGAGHLHFTETWSTSPTGTLSLDARVISGDGALAGLHGSMHFAGSGDPATGKGTGTYTANFAR